MCRIGNSCREAGSVGPCKRELACIATRIRLLLPDLTSCMQPATAAIGHGFVQFCFCTLRRFLIGK